MSVHPSVCRSVNQYLILVLSILCYLAPPPPQVSDSVVYKAFFILVRSVKEEELSLEQVESATLNGQHKFSCNPKLISTTEVHTRVDFIQSILYHLIYLSFKVKRVLKVENIVLKDDSLLSVNLLSVCLSVCLSICLSVCLSVCLLPSKISKLDLWFFSNE